MINLTQYHNSLLINTLESHQSLLMLLNFIDSTDLQNIHQAIQSANIKLSNTTKNIISSFIFTKKYLTKVDRTMSYFIYENPLIHHIDTTSALNIALNSSSQAQNLLSTFDQLFTDLNQKCMMNSCEVQSLKMIVTEPDLPLPVSLRSNVGEYCSSNLQLFICSKIVQTLHSFHDDSEFTEFKSSLCLNEEKYIKSIMTNTSTQNPVLTNIRQLYENPELFMQKIQETEEVFLENNHIYNFFVTILKLTQNIIKSIKLRLKSVQSDPYVYFTEFLLRYSLYKNYILQLEQNFGLIVNNFKSILEDSLNINFTQGNTQNEFSLWKILIKTFSSSMETEIQKCLPIYMNLTHKMRLILNNEMYAEAQLAQKGNLMSGMQECDGSPVLDQLLNEENIDNLEIFLSDFVEMLVDLSVDESNVLLCGSSKQQLLNKNFESWQQVFIEHQVKVLRKMMESKEVDKMKENAKEEFQFLEKNLNIKPRTLRAILKELNTDLIRLDLESVDEKINQVYRRYFGEVEDLRLSQKSHGSSLTANSEGSNQSQIQFDFQGLEYFSEVDEEQTLLEIDF